MNTCSKCNSQVAENYCSNCGQSARLERIDRHYISHEILHLLHFEKGFFYTAKELTVRPGDSIRAFIASDRAKHMKPIAYLILTSLLFTLIAHFFHVDEIYNEKEKLVFGKSSIETIQHWVQTHYGYGNILMGAFIVLWVKVLFRQYSYNLFEIAVLLCFVMGHGMLLLTVETFFANVLSRQLYIIVLSVISLAYPTWAIGQFFSKKKIASYLKAFFAYLLGYISFYAGIILVGLATDLLLKGMSTH